MVTSGRTVFRDATTLGKQYLSYNMPNLTWPDQ
jgi:hypothetical protein